MQISSLVSWPPGHGSGLQRFKSFDVLTKNFQRQIGSSNDTNPGDPAKISAELVLDVDNEPLGAGSPEDAIFCYYGIALSPWPLSTSNTTSDVGLSVRMASSLS